MNRLPLQLVRAAAFTTVLGSGYFLLLRRASPGTHQPAVPATAVAPFAVPPAPITKAAPPVEPAPLRPLAGFEATAPLTALLDTMEKKSRPDRPGISLQATGKTWALTGGWSPAQLEALMLATLDLKDEGGKLSCLFVLFEQLAMNHPARALELSETLPPECTTQTVSGLLLFLAEKNALAAQTWLDQLPPERASAFASITSILKKTAAAKPASKSPPAGELNAALAAWQKARKEPNAGPYSNHDARPVLEWANRTRQWAAALNAVEDSSLRKLLHLDWAAQDAEGWLAWMRDHPQAGTTGSNRRDILRDALSQMITHAAVGRPIKTFGQRLEAMISLIDQDRKLLMEQLGTKGTFHTMAFPNWIAAQPTEASGWVQRHQNEPWIQPVIESLATHVAKDDPLAAMAWAAKLTDPAQRLQCTREVHRIWRSHEPTAADAWGQANAGLLAN